MERTNNNSTLGQISVPLETIGQNIGYNQVFWPLKRCRRKCSYGMGRMKTLRKSLSRIKITSTQTSTNVGQIKSDNLSVSDKTGLFSRSYCKIGMLCGVG